MCLLVPDSNTALIRLALTFVFAVLVSPPIPAQEKDAAAGSAIEDSKVGRYHEALRKRPDGGYLFGRFYDAWLDRGTVAGLETFLKSRSEMPDATTADRLLLGFFYARQGEETRGIEVFTKALAGDPGNAAAWFEKAKLEARTLDFESAITDLDHASGASPDKELALQIGKSKGQWLARSGKTEEALAVWKELAASEPDDDELREDLIELFLDEGFFEEAAAASEQLVADTKDPYLKVLRKLRTGDIFQRAGKREQAVEAYTDALSKTGHGTWIEKETLAQIEKVFRQEDDLEGLRGLYETLTESEGSRVALRTRQAQLLGELGQAEAAETAWSEVLRLTPGDRVVRESYIKALGEMGSLARAVDQAKALADQYPDDRELRFGLANFQAESGQADDAAKTLSAILESVETADPAAETVHLRVARTLERIEENEGADATFAQMRELWPGKSSIEEEYAGYLYRTERPEEAIEIWRELAASGDPAEVMRAGRALMTQRAYEAALEILKVRYDELKDRAAYLGMLAEAAQWSEREKEAWPWVRRRVALAAAPVDLHEALGQAIILIRKGDFLNEAIDDLQESAALTAGESCLLSELLDVSGDWEGAEKVLAEAAGNGDSENEKLLVAMQRVRLLEQRQNWTEAAEAVEKLLKEGIGQRTAHLRSLVEFGRRSYDYDAALRWIPEWKKTSPGSVTPWLMEARMHGEKGDLAIAIDGLRRAAQRFEDDENVRVQLAEAYAANGQMADAERIYWRLHDEAPDLDAKLSWMRRLIETVQYDGNLEDIIARLRERQAGNRQSVGPLLALAEVYRATEDYEERRKCLMEAARLRPDDVALLHAVARIEENAGEWEQAVTTLEAARAIDRTGESLRRIARLHLTFGDEEEGVRLLWESKGGDGMSAHEAEQFAGALGARGDWESLQRLLEPVRARYPNDWRLAYQMGLAMRQQENYPAAEAIFFEILDAREDLQRLNRPGATARFTIQSRWENALQDQMPPGVAMLNQASQAIYAVGHQGRQNQIQLPGSLDEAHRYALAELEILSSRLDDEAFARMEERIERSGPDLARIFFRLCGFRRNEWTGEAKGLAGERPRKEALKVFSDFPDHPALAAVRIVGWIQDESDFTADAGREQFERMREDYPAVALLAALAAGLKLQDDGLDLIESGTELMRSLEPKTYIFYYVAAVLNSQLSEQSLPSEGDPYGDRVRGLIDESVRWFRTLAVSDSDPDMSAWTFYLIRELLTKHGEDERLIEILEVETKRATDPNVAGQGTLNWWGSNTGHPLDAEPAFPPVEIPDFPEHIRDALTDRQQSWYGGTEIHFNELKPDRVRKIENPVLRILVAERVGEEELVKEAIGEMIEARPPSLQGLVLGASHAAADGDPARAAEIFARARNLPMSAGLRRTVDSGLMWCALNLPDNEENARWIREGRDAALRLRRQARATGEREILLAALEDLGLDTEAAKVEKQLNQASASSALGSSGDPEEFLTRLVEDSKRDEAVRYAVRTIRQQAASISRGINNQQPHQVRQRNRGFFEAILIHDLGDEAIGDLNPGDSQSAVRWIEHALAADWLRRDETALASFRRALELRPESKVATENLIRLGLWQCETVPQFLEMFESIDRADVAEARGVGNAITQVIDNREPGVESIGGLHARFLEAVRLFLEKHRDRAGDEDFSPPWLENGINRLMRARFVSGDVSVRPLHWRDNFEPAAFDSAWNQFQDEKLLPPEIRERVTGLRAERRRQIEAVCREMLRFKGLARSGLAMLQIMAEAAGEDPADLIPLAEKVIFETAPITGKGTGMGISDNYHPGKPGISVEDQTAEMSLFRQMAKAGNSEILTGKLIPQLQESGAETAAKEAQETVRLFFCEPEEFTKVTLELIRKPGDSNLIWIRLDTAMQVWIDRGLAVDLTPVMVAAIGELPNGLSDFSGSARAIRDWLGRQLDSGGPESLRPIFKAIIDSQLGPEGEERDRLIGEWQENVVEKELWNWQRRSRHPVARTVAFLANLYQENSLRFGTAGIFESELPVVDLGQQLGLIDSSRYEQPEIRKFLSHAPFTADLDEFRTLPRSESHYASEFANWFGRLGLHQFGPLLKWEKERGRDTFGTRLIAVIRQTREIRSATPLADFVEKHLDEIKAAPDPGREEIGRFAAGFFHEAKDRESLKSTHPAVLDWLEPLFEKREEGKLTRESCLAVKDWAEFARNEIDQPGEETANLVRGLLEEGSEAEAREVTEHYLRLAAERRLKVKNEWHADVFFRLLTDDREPEILGFAAGLYRNSPELSGFRQIENLLAGDRNRPEDPPADPFSADPFGGPDQWNRDPNRNHQIQAERSVQRYFPDDPAAVEIDLETFAETCAQFGTFLSREESASILLPALRSRLMRVPGGNEDRKKAADKLATWASGWAKEGGHPRLAETIENGARFHSWSAAEEEKEKQSGSRPLVELTPELAFFLRDLRDETISPGWRIDLASSLCLSAGSRSPREVLMAGIPPIAQAWQQSPRSVNSNAGAVLWWFSNLENENEEHREEWRQAAESLAEGWNRWVREHDRPQSGLEGQAMVRVLLRLGEEGASPLKRTLRRFERHIASDPGIFVQLVEWGDTAVAARWLRSHWENFGSNYGLAIHSDKLAERIATVSEAIADPDLQYFSEVVLAAAPGPDDDARSARLRALAVRLAEIEFRDGSIRGSLLKRLISSEDRGLPEALRKAIVESLAGVNLAAMDTASDWTALRNTKSEEVRQLFEADLKAGDWESAWSLVDRATVPIPGASEQPTRRNYRERYLLNNLIEISYGDFLTDVLGEGAGDEESSTWLRRLEAFLELPDRVRLRARYRVAQTILAGHAIAGTKDKFDAWRKTLTEEQEAECRHTSGAPLTDALNAWAEWHRENDTPLALEKRLEVLGEVLSDPWCEEILSDLFEGLVEDGYLSRDELLRHGEALVERQPRQGIAAENLAVQLLKADRTAEALVWIDRAVAETTAALETSLAAESFDLSTARQHRLRLGKTGCARAVILIRNGREKDGLAVLTETIDHYGHLSVQFAYEVAKIRVWLESVRK